MTINFTRAELAAYIKKKLGGAVWRIEGFENSDAVEVCIDEAVMKYSAQVPSMGWETIKPFAKTYVITTPDVIGVLNVAFLEAVNRFSSANLLIGLTQNLTGVVPINVAGTTPNISGDIMGFLQWRKSFQRVTSTLAQWFYDDTTKTITMYNPAGYMACAVVSRARRFDDKVDTIKPNHKDWLRGYALALAKDQLGTYRRKFQNSIQGPGGTKLDLDADSLKDEAAKEIESHLDKLMKIRPMAWPMFD